MSHGGFIGDLCVALAHRWDPERLFVIFTAYFDEADTHGPAPTIIMAGFLGHAYQWRRFETKLARLQARDAFTVFHAKEFKAKSGEFHGWTDEKCSRLINNLTELVAHDLSEGLTVALEHGRYVNEYRAPPIPKKMNLDSQYGVCFRACLTHLADIMKARGYKDTLHIVIERGHTNVWDCERIFNDLKMRYRRAGANFLGSFTVETKENCTPLMMGDFLAAFYSMLRAQHPQGMQIYAKHAPEPSKGEAGLTFLELLPDALHNLKAGFEKMRQMEIDAWRAAKTARKAGVL